MLIRSTLTLAIRRTLLAAAIAAITLSAARAQENEGNERTLQGTWAVAVTLQNCSTGVAVAPPFQSLLTFARGGTMTETTSNPSIFPAERSPGHGVWERTAVDRYRSLTVAYITVNGTLVKTQSIEQKIVLLDDDHFRTTSAAISFVKPDGTPAGAGCAIGTGKRIELDQ